MSNVSLPFGIPYNLPYREARDGFWGEQTSTLNWCEEDYNVTYYCAEFINTLSNLVFMYLGVKGIRNCLSHSHSPVMLLTFMGYIVIGLGSMAFHATLKYSMQLADELPMIYTTCIMGYATFSYARSRIFSFWLASALIGLAAFITAYYHMTKNPVFHQIAYACLTIAVISRGAYVTKYDVEPALKQRNPAKADKIMRDNWSLVGIGIAGFLIGFAIWNLDNIYCRRLVSWRHHILLPWSIVLEGHGWWHLFTGLAYHLIVWRVWIECCLARKEDQFELQWSWPFGVPEVVPSTPSKALNGQNGGKMSGKKL